MPYTTNSNVWLYTSDERLEKSARAGGADEAEQDLGEGMRESIEAAIEAKNRAFKRELEENSLKRL